MQCQSDPENGLGIKYNVKIIVSAGLGGRWKTLRQGNLFNLLVPISIFQHVEHQHFVGHKYSQSKIFLFLSLFTVRFTPCKVGGPTQGRG